MRGIAGDEDGVPIRRSPRHVLSRQHSARARDVLDNHGPALRIPELLRENARQSIGGAPWREGNNELDGSLRILLRRRLI